jgi:hypothetical protein
MVKYGKRLMSLSCPIGKRKNKRKPPRYERAAYKPQQDLCERFTMHNGLAKKHHTAKRAKIKKKFDLAKVL